MNPLPKIRWGLRVREKVLALLVLLRVLASRIRDMEAVMEMNMGMTTRPVPPPTVTHTTTLMITPRPPTTPTVPSILPPPPPLLIHIRPLLMPPRLTIPRATRSLAAPAIPGITYLREDTTTKAPTTNLTITPHLPIRPRSAKSLGRSSLLELPCHLPAVVRSTKTT